MKMHFVSSPAVYLILLLVSLHAIANDNIADIDAQQSVTTIDESLLPANPARLPVLGRGLEFPFRDIKAITDIRSYGIRPWGFEPVHNGIDLIVDNTGVQHQVGDTVAVLSSVDGTVKAIIDMDDFGATLVIIEINPSLYVTYNFEPQTQILQLQELQAASIDVIVGQPVRKGQKLGDLVVGEGLNGGSPFGSGNPHIDTRLLLFDPATVDPDDPVGDLITSEISHNDVGNLPTFLCPYDYSSVRSKSIYEKVLEKFDPAVQCTCPCRFPYNAAECGVGCVD